MGKYALHELFSDDTVNIIRYCEDFHPNPHASKSDKTVKTWAQRLGIWNEETGDHYNNMTAFLHPTPEYNRLVTIGKTYAFMFFMNDSIGREKVGKMTPKQIGEARRIVDRLYTLIHTGELPAGSGQIERGAYEASSEIRQLADPLWFRDFMAVMEQHLQPSFYDQNSHAQGQVLSVQEFIDRRLYVSGMYVTIGLIEFGDNQYLPWELLDNLDLSEPIQRLQWLCSAIGALMNDVFSYEKEFIVEGSDFNLIPIMYLNNPDWSFHKTIIKASHFVRNLVRNFYDLENDLNAELAHYENAHPAMVKAVKTHMLSLRGSVQATWQWEVFTDRYKNTATIFRENMTQSIPKQA